MLLPCQILCLFVPHLITHRKYYYASVVFYKEINRNTSALQAKSICWLNQKKFHKNAAHAFAFYDAILYKNSSDICRIRTIYRYEFEVIFVNRCSRFISRPIFLRYVWPMVFTLKEILRTGWMYRSLMLSNLIWFSSRTYVTLTAQRFNFLVSLGKSTYIKITHNVRPMYIPRRNCLRKLLVENIEIKIKLLYIVWYYNFTLTYFWLQIQMLALCVTVDFHRMKCIHSTADFYSISMQARQIIGSFTPNFSRFQSVPQNLIPITFSCHSYHA